MDSWAVGRNGGDTGAQRTARRPIGTEWPQLQQAPINRRFPQTRRFLEAHAWLAAQVALAAPSVSVATGNAGPLQSFIGGCLHRKANVQFLAVV